MSRTSSNRAGQLECAVDLEEGAWYYDRERRELFTVRENRTRFDAETTRFVGTLTTEARDGRVSTYQAQDVEGWSFVHDIFPVPERVIEDPGIVREYAVEQIYEDIGVLGKSHEYTGIEEGEDGAGPLARARPTRRRMIELDGYEIGPPADAIQTEAILKSTAVSNPLDIFEKNRVLGPFDCGVLFSAG